MGEPNRARDLLEGAIKAFDSLPATTTVLDLGSQSRIDLGDTYSLLGQFNEAEAAYRAAREGAVRLITDTRGDPAARRTLARALDRLGSIAYLRGNAGDSEAALARGCDHIGTDRLGNPRDNSRGV